MKSVPGIPCPSRHAWPRPGIPCPAYSPLSVIPSPKGECISLSPSFSPRLLPNPAPGAVIVPRFGPMCSTRRGKVHLANSAIGGMGLKQRRAIGDGSGWGRVNGAGPILPYGPAPQIGLVGASGGAGPLHENRPAPLGILTCTIGDTDLHRTNGLQRYASPGITRLKYDTYHIAGQLDTV